MSTLRITHIPGDPPKFRVTRLRGVKQSDPVTVRSPVGYPVEGLPTSDLLRELRWYLEDFLGYPFPPETDRAERVLDALSKWGREAFDALFDTRPASNFLAEAQDGGRYDRLTLQIASDDPRILAWPWEALEDRLAAPLAQTCQIERCVDRVLDPIPLDERLPHDRVNILLVTARPYEQDVRFRSISRPLVELIAQQNLPAHVTVLRPPTFDELRRHLRDNPATYHVLHFDGHGGFGVRNADNTSHGAAPPGGTHMYQSEGVLVFEDAAGKPSEVTAEQLSALLREHAVPAVVLNACRSAMLDAGAQDPFASVAAALLKSGVRSVVAMAYSLYVSGARRFVPAFYDGLFHAGDVARAVRAGRQEMFLHRGRICARGEFPLQDWLVPVVYQQDPLDFFFAASAPKEAPQKTALPEEARDAKNPYGFVGRDGPLLELERAMLRPPAAILIQGLGGVGKTTLARGFVEWLNATGGLGKGCFWLDFREIRSAEYVINRMGEPIFGAQFAAAPLAAKIDRLAAALRDNRVVTVWDNFEVARGIPDSSVSANLPDEDCDALRSLLEKLRGGKSKVLITSRSREEWLGSENCFEVQIRGLDGDERWEFCEVVLRDLGLTPDRGQPEMIELMKLLAGHPLAMRAILPRLRDQSAAALVEALRNNLDALHLPESDVSRHLAATLQFVEQSLPDELRPLLLPLSLHEAYFDLNTLEAMARKVDAKWTRETLERFVSALSVAGLLRIVTDPFVEIHPAMTGFLRARLAQAVDETTRETWERAFADVLSALADNMAPRPLHEQRLAFHVHGANFRFSLELAERRESEPARSALLQSLAAYALNTRDYENAARLSAQLAKARRSLGDHKGEAGAYHQLGNIAEERRDLETAEKWYRKSLSIREKQEDDSSAAATYHQLGIIAQTRRHFDDAEKWFRKSLDIEEKHGNEHGAATTYHQIGTIAAERGNFDAAEEWYRKSLEITEKQGREDSAAATYHHLGVIAQERNDNAAAEKWYRKSLEITQKLGLEYFAACTYHQMGRIAQGRREFDRAEKLYRRSLEFNEKSCDEHSAAVTYHQLGTLAHERRDLDAAEEWYEKSLVINERYGDEHGAANTCAQLGIVAAERGAFEDFGRLLIRSVLTFASTDDVQGAQRNRHNYVVIFNRAPTELRPRLAEMWREAGLGELPTDVAGAADATAIPPADAPTKPDEAMEARNAEEPDATAAEGEAEDAEEEEQPSRVDSAVDDISRI